MEGALAETQGKTRTRASDPSRSSSAGAPDALELDEHACGGDVVGIVDCSVYSFTESWPRAQLSRRCDAAHRKRPAQSLRLWSDTAARNPATLPEAASSAFAESPVPHPEFILRAKENVHEKHWSSAARHAVKREPGITVTPHDIFYKVDLEAWVRGTIRKHREGVRWRPAWIETYREIGGVSWTSAGKACPMTAAQTLYELGRIRNAGVPFTECGLHELWRRSRNGTCAILATRLLRERPDLDKASLWEEIQEAIRRQLDEEPARTNQDGPTLTYKLWHLGLIVDGPE